jgi:hypothetical protein
MATRTAYRQPPNPYVSLAQARALDLYKSLQSTATTHIARARARPPQDHLITFASSFILAIALRWLTMSKGDHLITISLLLNVVLFSLITTLIQGHTGWVQYSSTVVFFSAMLSLHLVHTSPLVLAALPLAIDQLKLAIVKTAQKANTK